MSRIIEAKIKKIVSVLYSHMFVKRIPVNAFYVKETGYRKNSPIPSFDGTWQLADRGCIFEGDDSHYWIYKRMKTPAVSNKYESVFLELKTGREGQWDATNPQCTVYIDGKAEQGLDVNHTDIKLDSSRESDFYFYLYGGMKKAQFYADFSFYIKDERIEKLYYDLAVPCDSLSCFEEYDEEYVKTSSILNRACNILDLRVPYSDEYFNSINRATEFLKAEFYDAECGKSDTDVSLVGHTHIDVAWRWTLAQTEEKAQRSFATVLKLMDEYKDYTFMSSQPQLYEYVKNNDRELYSRIKDRVKDGRFNPEGAMWLEADCNLTSGESLIRQIIYGKRFFKEEFGVDSKILWLPDVFGYSSALPQILNKTGVETFVTSKISWNDTNKLPYDSFVWEGLDGSEIFTVFITAQNYKKGEAERHTTYVGDITPSMVKGTRHRFQQKEYSNSAILTFGYGDGGGGPTRKMLEYSKRLRKGLPGIPKAEIRTVSEAVGKMKTDFIEGCKRNNKIPRWVGELYLEFHRGTYTSMAKNKKNNRKSEFLMQNAEQLSVLCEKLKSEPYNREEFRNDWKLILLNQFHDILPGSSIEEVYRDSDVDYKKIINSAEKNILRMMSLIASSVGKTENYVVYNPNSFSVSDYVLIDGKCAYIENVPPMGWRTVKTPDFSDTVTVKDNVAENKYYILTLDRNGNISSLYDKENNREVIESERCGNVIEAFEDLPYSYDNWELSSYYKEKKWNVNDVRSIEIIKEGARSGFKITRNFLSSQIVQRIYLYGNSRRIDFSNRIDWKESHIVLKASFPLNVHANTASYETQFGYLERPTHENTSFDKAKYEVCAHKYADISEDDYGVAILNDCKYGYSAEGSTLKITLLKCGTEPNPNADKEIHEFTYSLYPHRGNHRQGNVIKEAYVLNRPLNIIKADGDGSLPNEFSMLKVDRENIIAETVKKSEDGSSTVVRAYDAYNRKTEAEFDFGFEIQHAYLCDMLENKIRELEICDGHKVSLPVSNFEIVTFCVE